ncbi:RRXRR domain-containing protein [Fervidobacterium islandicum]|nr:RRXRR domain-containing protein [Fervidobacterium changbaicum]
MVFVLDKNKKPLMPCSEKRARQLVVAGQWFTKCIRSLYV